VGIYPYVHKVVFVQKKLMTGARITLMNLLHRKDYFNNEGDAVPAHVE
jgi:hypothetical protein